MSGIVRNVRRSRKGLVRVIAVQRHRLIVKHVLGHGAARVSDLARTFDVTEETIRRDLRTLARQGVIARTHGGAVALDPGIDVEEPPYDAREATNREAKEAIARAALRHVPPKSVIALDASSTVCTLARLLPDEPLTVVTNSLVICSLLARRRHIEVICTGGTLESDSMAFTGLHARRTIESLNINALFFSCRGVDFDRGLSEANDRHASIKLQMIESSQRRVLLVDSSKLGGQSTVFIGPIGLADCVLTERPDDAAARANLERLRACMRHVEIIDCT